MADPEGADLRGRSLVGGAVVAAAWDYEGAFVIVGSIGLASAVLALFLKAPDRPKPRDAVPDPHPLGEETA
ncbi:hypothetical protein ABZ092_26900 [Streptomyces bobili]|uniref:hypothetical protein n=1 Tax=Streptomyces bobili TaxID=67280 RepID=UPI0033AA202F